MKEPAQERQSRRVLYRVLQALYSYPLSRDKVGPLVDLRFDSEAMETAFASLRKVLARVTDWDAFIVGLNVEYTRLFEGPGFLPAPPYASYYLNGERLMGPETVAARRTYLKEGVAARQRGQTPDDHIALELAFMAHLSDKIAEALDKGDDERCRDLRDVQKHFLRDHLLPWVPVFCLKVAAATPHEF
ncbi:MAG: molecular chaperone TorD family protein, partial [Rhodospirillales bacterium]|nr:molecular chaperone TorD family protein [Rhodospirillales bacterium]